MRKSKTYICRNITYIYSLCWGAAEFALGRGMLGERLEVRGESHLF